MAYAIVINLDYDSYPEPVCQDLWRKIRTSMLQVGFRLDGRLFLIQEDADSACALALEAMALLDIRFEEDVQSLSGCIRDFYGYERGETRNLLLPDGDGIEVREGFEL